MERHGLLQRKKVISWEQTGQGIYDGVVSGSGNNKYTVHIDTKHPRKSSCNCPFADGRQIVCKHMIALYFTAEPKAASDFLKEVEEWEAEEEAREQEHYEEIKKEINKLSKAELRERLFEAWVELDEMRNRWRVG